MGEMHQFVLYLVESPQSGHWVVADTDPQSAREKLAKHIDRPATDIVGRKIEGHIVHVSTTAAFNGALY